MVSPTPLDQYGYPDHRTALERVTVHRDRALRSLQEIATAAWAVIDAHPELLSPLDAETSTPLDTLLLKLAVWEHVDDQPSLADYGITIQPFLGIAE